MNDAVTFWCLWVILKLLELIVLVRLLLNPLTIEKWQNWHQWVGLESENHCRAITLEVQLYKSWSRLQSPSEHKMRLNKSALWRKLATKRQNHICNKVLNKPNQLQPISFIQSKLKPHHYRMLKIKGHTMPIHACQLVSAMFHVNVHISVCMYSIIKWHEYIVLHQPLDRYQIRLFSTSFRQISIKNINIK